MGAASSLDHPAPAGGLQRPPRYAGRALYRPPCYCDHALYRPPFICETMPSSAHPPTTNDGAPWRPPSAASLSSDSAAFSLISLFQRPPTPNVPSPPPTPSLPRGHLQRPRATTSLSVTPPGATPIVRCRSRWDNLAPLFAITPHRPLRLLRHSIPGPTPEIQTRDTPLDALYEDGSFAVSNT